MAGMFGSVDDGVSNAASKAAFKQNLNKVYTWYTGGFLVFLILLAILEQLGLSRSAIGISFLLATVGLYAHRTARHRVKVGECLSSTVEPL